MIKTNKTPYLRPMVRNLGSTDNF